MRERIAAVPIMNGTYGLDGEDAVAIARAVISVVREHIVEECARVLDARAVDLMRGAENLSSAELIKWGWGHNFAQSRALEHAAAAIRASKEQP